MSIDNIYMLCLSGSCIVSGKQIQQNYRPIIAVHKWFARRPGTLFRGLLLSEFGDAPVEDTTIVEQLRGRDHRRSLHGRRHAAAGGKPDRVQRHRMDINPMAAWIVQEEIDALDLKAYRNTAERLLLTCRGSRPLYKTRCPMTGRKDADVKYFLWVKTGPVRACRKDFDLFPGYLLAEDATSTVECACLS